MCVSLLPLLLTSTTIKFKHHFYPLPTRQGILATMSEKEGQRERLSRWLAFKSFLIPDRVTFPLQHDYLLTKRCYLQQNTKWNCRNESSVLKRTERTRERNIFSGESRKMFSVSRALETWKPVKKLRHTSHTSA